MAPNYHTIDPCEDWDQYVCGGFKTYHRSREDHVEADVASVLGEELDGILKDILTSDEKAVAEMINPKSYADEDKVREIAWTSRQNFKVMQEHWRDCLEYSNKIIDSRKEMISNLANWPLADLVWSDIHEPLWRLDLMRPYTEDARFIEAVNTSEPLKPSDAYGIAVATSKLATHGAWVFAKYAAIPSRWHKAKMIVSVTPYTKTGLQLKTLYEDAPLKREYARVMRPILERLWTFNSPHLQEKRILPEQIIEFERRLHAIFPTGEGLRDVKSARLVLMEDLGRAVPELLLNVSILQHRFESNANVESIEHVAKSVDLISPHYWKQLSSVLHETPKEVVRGYFLWQTFLQTERYWGMKWAQPWRDFRDKIQGSRSDFSHEQRCLTNIKRAFRSTLEEFFLSRIWRDSSIGWYAAVDRRNLDTYRLGKVLRERLAQMVSETAWLPQKFRTIQSNKIQAVVAVAGGYAGHSPWGMYNIQDWYKSAKLRGLTKAEMPMSTLKEDRPHTLSEPLWWTPIHDYLKLETIFFNATWARLNKAPYAESWPHEMAVWDTKWHFSPTMPHVVLSAGLRMPPFWHEDAPGYVNYGGFGALTAEGLAYGVTDQGIYHGESNILNGGGMTEHTSKEILDRMQCYVERYDGMNVTDSKGETHTLKGKGLLGEAMAAAIGTELAYKAWKDTQKDHSDKQLPYLANFTTDQLFFIFRSASKCGVEKAFALERRVLEGSELPFGVRTRAHVEDSKAWHDAFKCKKKTPVCQVWGKDDIAPDVTSETEETRKKRPDEQEQEQEQDEEQTQHAEGDEARKSQK